MNQLLIRQILKFYRLILSFFFKKSNNSVMKCGVSCSISEFEFDINKGDIVHPCVRYSEKLFKGHHWWLIYTPYYDSNPDLENPILCYGIDDDGIAPLKWEVYCQIVNKPLTGYNSDPTMFFDEEGLNIYWRENHTPRTRFNNLERCTYGCVITEEGKYNMENPILPEKNIFSDREVSPTIINKNSKYIGFAMHLKFKNPKLHLSYMVFDKYLNMLLRFVAFLEIYNEQKSFGIAIWKSERKNQTFNYLKTTKLKNCNKLYRPWHLDIFEHNNECYAIIQSNQSNADICLAVSSDYENFTMFKKPLITNDSINKIGIYKPTVIIHNGILNLYYTSQDLNNRLLNKMYLTSLPFNELIEKLNKNS